MLRAKGSSIRFIAALVIAGAAASGAWANSSADLKKAQDSVNWLNNFACPVPGQHMVVAGLESAAQIEALRASNWEFVQTTHARMMEASAQLDVFLQQAAGRRLSSKDEAALDRLQSEAIGATARVATALVNWSLANFVEISRTNPDFDSRSRQDHPLRGQLQRAQALQQFVASFYTLPQKSALVTPVEKKFWACLQAAQVSVIDGSAASIRKAKAEATSSADIDRIASSYVLIDPAPSSALFTELAAAKQEFLALERLAAEEREKLRQQQLAQQAAERAKQEAEREAAERERNAKRVAQASANLPVARRLVMALDAGVVSEAATVMDEDISLSVPGMSTTYGKSSVLQLMNRGSGSQGGAIESPQVNSRGDIVANGQGSRGRFQLYIDVSGGLVTAMRIVR